MSTQTAVAPQALSAYEDEVVAQAIALLSERKKVTDAVVYAKPYKKLAPRDRAYYRGWYLRNAVVAADPAGFDKPDLKVHTVKSGDGYRWVLERKAPTDA